MHPPRNISATPQEIAAASLPAFMAMLGKQEELIGGKHARKQLIKHLSPDAGQRIGLATALESERFEGVELSDWPSRRATKTSPSSVQSESETHSEDGAFDAIAIHHLAFGNDADTQLQAAVKALKAGGRMVLHDMIWRQTPPTELLQAAPEVWQLAIAPQSVAELWRKLEALGLGGLKLDLGAFAWFRPKQFARDEGKYASDILFNALRNPVVRARYLAAFDHFQAYERFYGYLVISGVTGVSEVLGE